MSVTLSAPGTKHLWRILALSSALAFAYATVLVKLGQDWWNDENYSHGLLIPLVIGYFLWSQRARLAGAVQRPTNSWDLRLLFLLCLRYGPGRPAPSFTCRGFRLVLHARRDGHVFLGLSSAATLFVPLLLLMSGDSDSHDSLQQNRFPVAALRIALCCLGDDAF